MVAQLEPLSRALVECIGIPVTQLELDMFVVGLHRSRTDPEFLRDPAGPEPGAAQGKDMQLAVGQVRGAKVRCRMIGQLVNGTQRDLRADIELACENGFDGLNQLFPRPGLHPVA